MVIRQPFVWSWGREIKREGERESAEARSTPCVIFHPDKKTTGLLQRIPDDLIWQCGGAATRSGSDGKRPKTLGLLPVSRASQPRQQPNSLNNPTATLMFPSFKRNVDCFSSPFFNTSCKTYTLSSKTTLVSLGVNMLLNHETPRSVLGKNDSPPLQWGRTSPSYGAAAFLQHSVLLCL